MLAEVDEYQVSDSDLLKVFYGELFPCRLISKWLSYDPKAFKNREFSFTFSNGSYLRFQSFEDSDQLQSFLSKNVPVKIDLGAIYSAKPNERKILNSKAFKPLERELIFDLDMTDYDGVRTCCSGKNVCSKCWKFLACAMRIIDKTLEEDFGYEKRLWVFSGRRGIHCWVADEKARKLAPNCRKAIVNYLEEQSKSSSESAGSKPFKNHPFFSRSMEIMKHFFESYVMIQQDVFASEENISKFLALPGICDFASEIQKAWRQASSDPLVKWQLLCDVLEKAAPRKKQELLNQVIMHYMLPRIDFHVSIQLNHLLKLPYCIHPDSGKLCVPVDANVVENFDPNAVPTLLDLVLGLKEAGNLDLPGSQIFSKFCDMTL